MVRIFIAADIRFYREGLAEILGRREGFDVVATGSTGPETAARVEKTRPEVVLLDMAMPDSFRTIAAIAKKSPATTTLVLAVPDNEQDVLACAEAGARGFVPRGASINELTDRIRSALRGEVRCSPRIVSSLMQRVWSLARGSRITAASATRDLTARQLEVLELVDEGLSNKEIAQRLHIGLPTVKNHIHNILEKLRVRNRRQAAAALRGAGI